ncbi:uncharacterized protein [Misgurnus anguillicaudatus]|uniref:uncharacterized protein n=1 Tax=Misgurnus anguillicaudatus TaxID=75329 RepID=UPI003CCF51F5
MRRAQNPEWWSSITEQTLAGNSPFPPQRELSLQDYAKAVERSKGNYPDFLASEYFVAGLNNPPPVPERESLVSLPYWEMVSRVAQRQQPRGERGPHQSRSGPLSSIPEGRICGVLLREDPALIASTPEISSPPVSLRGKRERRISWESASAESSSEAVSPMTPSPATASAPRPRRKKKRRGLLGSQPDSSPLQPSAQLQPLQPSAQLQPIQPSAQLQPLQPSAQLQPLQPSAQLQPLQPSAQLQPLQPSAQLQPLQPSAQLQPLQPSAQLQPLSRLCSPLSRLSCRLQRPLSRLRCRMQRPLSRLRCRMQRPLGLRHLCSSSLELFLSCLPPTPLPGLPLSLSGPPVLSPVLPSLDHPR